jgi:hypothetical protein
MMATNDDDATQPSLLDFAGSDLPAEQLIDALMADPATARLLVAWRRSVIKLEQARAAALEAGDVAWVHWVDTNVRVKPSGDV